MSSPQVNPRILDRREQEGLSMIVHQIGTSSRPPSKPTTPTSTTSNYSRPTFSRQTSSVKIGSPRSVITSPKSSEQQQEFKENVLKRLKLTSRAESATQLVVDNILSHPKLPFASIRQQRHSIMASSSPLTSEALNVATSVSSATAVVNRGAPLNRIRSNTTMGLGTSIAKKRKSFKRMRQKSYLCDEITNRYNIIKIYTFETNDENHFQSSSSLPSTNSQNSSNSLPSTPNGSQLTEDDFDFLTSIKNKVLEEERKEAQEYLKQMRIKKKLAAKRKADLAKAQALMHRLTKVSAPKPVPLTLDLMANEGESLLDTMLSRRTDTSSYAALSEVEEEGSGMNETDESLSRVISLLSEIGNPTPPENETPHSERKKALLGQDPEYFGSKELYEAGIFFKKDVNDGTTFSHVARKLSRQNSDSDLLSERFSFLSCKHVREGSEKKHEETEVEEENVAERASVMPFVKSLGLLITDTKLNWYKLKQLWITKKPMLKRCSSESDLSNLANHDKILEFTLEKKRSRSASLATLSTIPDISSIQEEKQIKRKPLATLKKSASSTNFIFKNIQRLKDIAKVRTTFQKRPSLSEPLIQFHKQPAPEPLVEEVKEKQQVPIPSQLMSLNNVKATPRTKELLNRNYMQFADKAFPLSSRATFRLRRFAPLNRASSLQGLGEYSQQQSDATTTNTPLQPSEDGSQPVAEISVPTINSDVLTDIGSKLNLATNTGKLISQIITTTATTNEKPVVKRPRLNHRSVNRGAAGDTDNAPTKSQLHVKLPATVNTSVQQKRPSSARTARPQTPTLGALKSARTFKQV